MVLVKVKKDLTTPEKYLKNAIHYVHDKDGVPPIAFEGNGVNPRSVKEAFDQMYRVKKYFGKTSGNPLVHIIVCYDKYVLEGQTAARLSWSIASYYMKGFQYIVCTHAKDHECNHFHCHIILNSVSFKDGKMFHSGIQEMSEFCDYVGWITGRPTKFVFEKVNHNKDGPTSHKIVYNS